MSWNLFDRIINALRPSKESEQPVDTSQSRPQESEQPADTSQSWPEGGTEPPEASEEPSPDFQETANPAEPNQWQD
jgi:hypothetical protein